MPIKHEKCNHEGDSMNRNKDKEESVKISHKITEQRHATTCSLTSTRHLSYPRSISQNIPPLIAIWYLEARKDQFFLQNNFPYRFAFCEVPNSSKII